MKKIFVLILTIIVFAISCGFSVAAETQDGITYTTYTFSYEGEVLESPHAYLPQLSYDGTTIGIEALRGAKDIKSDKNGLLYIVDTERNRVVVIDNQGKLVRVIDKFNNNGVTDTFSGPMGVFVTEDLHIYISDTLNARIIELDDKGNTVRIIEKPDSNLLPEKYIFAPSYIAVDSSGRMYVISEQTSYGIMVFDRDANFLSFLGAKKTTPKLSDLLWRRFMTKKQLEQLEKIVPTNYSNLTVDEKGFVYATTIIADNYLALNAIRERSIADDYAMIKKFNLSGDEILKRLGYFPPAGDISAKDFSYAATGTGNVDGASHIVGITLGQNNTYTAFDKKRNKIFTYDSEGNLMYAFGGTGSQLGLFTNISGGCYIGSDLYVLDSGKGQITKFVRTDYGNSLHQTIQYNEERQYEKSVESWKKILDENNNLTVALIGIGKAEMRLGNYKSAMSYLKRANDVVNYSKAFTYYRDDLLKQGWIFLLPVVVILLIAGIMFVSRKIRAYIDKPMPAGNKLLYRILFSNYVIYHPFNGFWDIKREKKGSLSAALIIFSAAAVSMVIRDLSKGYILDTTQAANYNIVTNLLGIFLIALLFCVANWALTSLMDGKGNFKNIVTTVGYSVTPIVFFSIPAGIISNFLSSTEMGIYSAIVAIGYIWCGFLLFFGILTIHEYSLVKNIVSFLLTVVAMIIILFIAILAINLGNRIFTFVASLYNELILRM